MKRKYLCLVCALLCSWPLGAAASQVTDEQWIDWVKSNAIQFDTLEWQRIDMNDLSFLDEALKGKRVVYLGEPDHYIHEKYDFRLILIRYLFEKGWRYIGMEMGLFDGFKVDRYLGTGNQAFLDQMQVYGFKGDLRSDRDDEIKGFPASRHPTFRSTFVAEEKWFLKQLRSLNESLAPGQKRLHWFGFDVDKRPGLGYARLDNLLSRQKGGPEIRHLITHIELIEGESRAEEAAKITKAIEYCESNKDSLLIQMKESDYRDMHKYLRGIKDSLIFLDGAIGGPQSRGWVPALIAREKVMFRLMDELLAELPKDEKIILMAHNMHLCKDYTTCGFLGFPMWPSIGTHVARKLPDQVYSIWMLYDRGSHANVTRPHVFEDVASDPGRIEHLMAKAGAHYLLPLNTGDPRAAYLDQQRRFVLNGGLGEGRISAQADAIFFVEKVQAIRLRTDQKQTK